jgi:hypothetical protein
VLFTPAPYINSPAVDTACVLAVGSCDPRQLAAMQGLRSQIVAAVRAGLHANERHGCFIDSISTHCQTDYWAQSTQIDNLTISAAVAKWSYGVAAGKTTKQLELVAPPINASVNLELDS